MDMSAFSDPREKKKKFKKGKKKNNPSLLNGDFPHSLFWCLVANLHFSYTQKQMPVWHKIKQAASSAVWFYRKKTIFENKMYSPNNPPTPTDILHGSDSGKM